MEEGNLVVLQGGDQEMVDLPPGFRFHPTDEEIITHYLKEKVLNIRFTAAAIGQADLNKNEPWDLPKIAKMGEKEFYFFCQRDRKYPTGMRTNRATVSGYWKATGKDKKIFKGKDCLVGMKKTLVFYRGRAPNGEKTNWVMHEYRLDDKYSYHNLPKIAKDEWVVCRVIHKNGPSTPIAPTNQLSRIDSFDIDHLLNFSSLPPLIDPGFLGQPGPSFSGASQQNNLKPVLQNPTTTPLHNSNLLNQTLNFPNSGSGLVKVENSIVSMSQETGLSSDVNAAATPEISSYTMMMNPTTNAAMIDDYKSDEFDDLIYWEDLFSKEKL